MSEQRFPGGNVAPEEPATLASFPKSGRTWLRVMLYRLGVRITATHEGSDHIKARHFEELTPPTPKRLAVKRVFLVRDPRDTAVSGYFQVSRRQGGYAGDIAQFMRDPRHGVEKNVRFNLMWAESPTLPELFFPVSYEALRADPVIRLSEIVNFLGAQRTYENVANAVDSSSFENMQRDEREGRLTMTFGDALTPRDLGDPDSYKVRRGKVGGFRDYLSEADIAHCDGLFERYHYAARLEKSLKLQGGPLF